MISSLFFCFLFRDISKHLLRLSAFVPASFLKFFGLLSVCLSIDRCKKRVAARLDIKGIHPFDRVFRHAEMFFFKSFFVGMCVGQRAGNPFAFHVVACTVGSSPSERQAKLCVTEGSRV